jgi:monooxygenase
MLVSTRACFHTSWRHCALEINMSVEHLDVLIVGAGVSGIDAAYRLKTTCPDRGYAILEAGEAIGGTWELFRFPGVRSDSDMYTYGFPFRPWTGKKSIADGASILKYLRDTAREFGIERKIRCKQRVTRATWSSKDALWTVEVAGAGEPIRLSCNFLLMCTGYFSYQSGHAPEFGGSRRFKGRIVHPQGWPESLDYSGKRVVVIGSGATAVTMVPVLAETAAHVTMLQRSPTYIVAWPDEDRIARMLHKVLPFAAAGAVARWKNALLGSYLYWSARNRPEKMKERIRNMQRELLGADYDLSKDFTPHYAPWDQRLCLAPNGDFFASIRNGRTSIVTDTIETFTERGIKLASGKEIVADIIVTATGLELLPLGGAQLVVDGLPVDAAQTMTYKGVMFSDIPNFAQVMGYINASWTLKADLASRYLCRLLNHLRDHGLSYCVPKTDDPSIERLPIVNFTSGYFQRALDRLPKQGSRPPWRFNQSYLEDRKVLLHQPIDDGVLKFVEATQDRSTVRAKPIAGVAGPTA